MGKVGLVVATLFAFSIGLGVVGCGPTDEERALQERYDQLIQDFAMDDRAEKVLFEAIRRCARTPGTPQDRQESAACTDVPLLSVVVGGNSQISAYELRGAVNDECTAALLRLHELHVQDRVATSPVTLTMFAIDGRRAYVLDAIANLERGLAERRAGVQRVCEP